MKKWIALCLGLVMCLGVLAGCTSADPENPYGQEPAPKNESASVVVVENV